MTVTTELDTITCPECAGVYAISAGYREESRRVGEFKLCWTCPYCETKRGYGTGESAKLRSEIEKLERSRERAQRELRDARAESKHFRRSRDGMKGALAKVKKRVGRGVCPCCNRQFENLRRHMETKHPEHATEPVKE